MLYIFLEYVFLNVIIYNYVLLKSIRLINNLSIMSKIVYIGEYISARAKIKYKFHDHQMDKSHL